VIASAAASAVLLPTRASAFGRCTNLSETLRQCQVGLKLGIDTARQRCDSWCWAACIEAVFATHGHPVPQEALVAKMSRSGGASPTEDCFGASKAMIVDAVTGGWYDTAGREFYAEANVLPLGWMGVRTPDNTTLGVDLADPSATALAMTQDLFSSGDLSVMVDELARENPLIISSYGAGLGHAVVLIGVTFFQSPSGNIALTELVVRDPWPGNPNLRTYSADEVRGTFSVIKISVGSN